MSAIVGLFLLGMTAGAAIAYASWAWKQGRRGHLAVAVGLVAVLAVVVVWLVVMALSVGPAMRAG